MFFLVFLQNKIFSRTYIIMKYNKKMYGTIPIKPYLLRFVQVIEGIEANEPLSFRRGSIIGHAIKLAFSYKQTAYDQNNVNKAYSENLFYSIPRGDFFSGRMFLTYTSVVHINQLIAKMFHEMLLQKILSYIEAGYTELAAIHDFMDLLGIEEMVDAETIKKANYRMRGEKDIESLQENLKSKKLLSLYPIRGFP